MVYNIDKKEMLATLFLAFSPTIFWLVKIFVDETKLIGPISKWWDPHEFYSIIEWVFVGECQREYC